MNLTKFYKENIINKKTYSNKYSSKLNNWITTEKKGPHDIINFALKTTYNNEYNSYPTRVKVK